MTLPPFPSKGFSRTVSVLTILVIAGSLQSHRGWLAILIGSLAVSFLVTGLGTVIWMLLSFPTIEARINDMPAWKAAILVLGGVAVGAAVGLPGTGWLGAVAFGTMMFAVPVVVLRWFRLSHPGVGAKITRGLCAPLDPHWRSAARQTVGGEFLGEFVPAKSGSLGRRR